MAIFEFLILNVILWYSVGIIGIIIIGNIVRCLQFYNTFKIIICIFIILVFPLSLLWFINHAILQIPIQCLIKEKKDILIRDVGKVETIYTWMEKHKRAYSCGMPLILFYTMLPNIALIVTVIIGVDTSNLGFSNPNLYLMITSGLMYLVCYGFFLVITQRNRFCLPCYAIFFTIASALIWILFIMKIFNGIGYQIFGLRERNWNSFYQDICGCTFNVYEREYNKYIKYFKWYIMERKNILNIYINDINVVDIILNYLNEMEYRDYFFRWENRGYLYDKDAVINTFSLNRNYIKKWISHKKGEDRHESFTFRHESFILLSQE